MSASLSFWNWSDRTPGQPSAGRTAILASIAAVIFVAGGVFSWYFGHRDRQSSPLPLRPVVWVTLFCVGLILLVLSFPAYLLLASARSVWRTQFLSAFGAVLVFASIAGGTAIKIATRDRLRAYIFLALTAIVVYRGAAVAIRHGAFHDYLWQEHRRAIAAVLSVAPDVSSGTVIVLVNVPKARDPFRHNMWFDLALRLAYPGRRVAGVYFYDDRTPSPGNNLKLVRDHWKSDGTAFPTDVRDTGTDHTLVVNYQEEGRGKLLDKLPEFLNPSTVAIVTYNPAALLTSRQPAPEAVRRYGPLPQ